MTHAEREHLFLLGGYAIKPPSYVEERPSEAILNLLAVLDPNPALCLSRSYDVLAWNKGAAAIFGDFGSFSERERNLVWRFFMDPAMRTILPRWSDVNCNLTAQFRAAAARYPDDARFGEIIEDLLAGSSEFRALWASHDVGSYRDGHKHLFHPQIGNIVLEYTRLNIPTPGDMRVSVYMAKPGSREAALLRSLVPETAEALQPA